MNLLLDNGKTFTLMSWIFVVAALVALYMDSLESAMFFAIMAQLESVDTIEFMSVRLTDEELDALVKDERKGRGGDDAP
jgi:hypothetical protein